MSADDPRRRVPRTDVALADPNADAGELRAAATRQGIEIRYEKRLVSLIEKADGVTAGFADGSTATADLLVGADGLHSRVRPLLDPAAPAPEYLGLLNAGGFTTAPVDADQMFKQCWAK